MQYQAYQNEEIDQMRRREEENMFVNSILLRFRGTTLTYNQAYRIIHEIIYHMKVEDTHHLLYEIYNRFNPEIQKMCQIKQTEYEKQLKYDMMMEVFRKKASPYFSSDKSLFEEIPKEPFLSKEDVNIK